MKLSWQRLGTNRCGWTQTPSPVDMNLGWQRLGIMVGRCQLKLFFREKEFKKKIK